MLSKNVTKLLAVIVVILSSGCDLLQVKNPPLPLPAPLDLPKISRDSLQCLDDETFTKLTVRDSILLVNDKVLRAIILSTHK